MPLDASTDSTARHGLLERVRKQGDKLFDRPGLLTLWQELAEQFHPTRADFTVTRTLGEDLAAHLTTSYPVVIRRDLGNTFSAMLRRGDWFKCRSSRPDKEDNAAKRYLDWATGLQRNAMYDRVAGLVRATREADHDFVTFGQCVIQNEMYRPRTGRTPHLLYRCRHLRDVAWKEGVTGQIDTIYRKDKPTAIDLKNLFGENRIHRKVQEKLEREPFHEFNIWHAVIPSDIYAEMPGGREIPQPWVSIYIDVDNDNHEMECVGQWVKGYTIPRWETVSGSPYAHSAAMVAALPDARLLQQVTLVLLEAGEKAVNPPTIATEDVIRSDIALYAGGTTWVSEEYDEKLGEALRPLTIDKSGLQFALDLVRDIRSSLKDATFLNKLDLPPVGGPDMTAYEVGQRVQEYIRNALPLFEPVEVEYNGALCEDTFELLFRNSPEMRNELPPSLMGAERRFEFDSPLKDAAEKAKAGQFVEASQIVTAAAQTDPNVSLLLDTMTAGRDVLNGITPAKWLRGEDEVERAIQNRKAEEQQAKLMALLQQGTQVAKTGSEAAANVSSAMPQFQIS